MVERLYRGKRIDNGEWVYGFYFCMYHDDDREHLHHFIIPLNVSIPKDRPIGEIQVEVDPDTVGQCVSDLPDKNGKKIFEGDIVKVTGLYPDRDGEKRIWRRIRVGEIFYYHGAFYFDKWLLCKTSEKCIEIIGNIHDNPELLEDKL